MGRTVAMAAGVARRLAIALVMLGGCGPIVSFASAGTTDDGAAADDEVGDGLERGDHGETGGRDGTSGGDSSSTPTSDAGGETSIAPGTDETGSTETGGDTSTGGAEPEPAWVRYRITIDNTWSEENHPGAFPPEAHFSWLGGATHDAGVSFWNVGELASPGIVQMAEIGATTILMGEVQPAIEAGHAAAALEWQQWFCPLGTDVAVCGEPTVEIDVHLDHSRVTLVSMLGPSPDWFVGVSGLDLHEGGMWADELVIDLVPYDGGTRSDLGFVMNGALEDPVLPISLITEESGQLVGPGVLGTMTFVRIEARSATP